MIHTLKLGGEERKVLFGYYAFRKLKEKDGLSIKSIISAMSDMNMDVVVNVLYHGLRAAEIAFDRPPTDYDLEKLCMWIDMEEGAAKTLFQWVTDSIADMVPSEDEIKENEEAKKKKKAK